MTDQFQVISKILLSEKECSGYIGRYDQDLDYCEQSTYRSVFIKEIEIDEKIKDSILDANNKLYKFHLTGEVECFFARYSEGCHYDTMHLDSRPSYDGLQRKLSFSILLNNNFTGGEFCTLTSTMATERGKLLVFPAFVPHKVTPVETGVRYVMFGFFLGNPWI